MYSQEKLKKYSWCEYFVMQVDFSMGASLSQVTQLMQEHELIKSWVNLHKLVSVFWFVRYEIINTLVNLHDFRHIFWTFLISNNLTKLLSSMQFRKNLINSYRVPCRGFYIAEIICRLTQNIDSLSAYQWKERRLRQTTTHLYFEKNYGK